MVEKEAKGQRRAPNSAERDAASRQARCIHKDESQGAGNERYKRVDVCHKTTKDRVSKDCEEARAESNERKELTNRRLQRV